MDIELHNPETKVRRTVTMPNLVFDFRIKGEEQFVDIDKLSLEELRQLSLQYEVYNSYHQMIIERKNVLCTQSPEIRKN